MNFSASDIYTLFRPSRCEKRVYLRSHGEPEAGRNEFEKLIEELGRRHEAKHLATFAEFEDLRSGSLEDRAANTLRAIEAGKSVIYQGVFQASLPDGGSSVIGIPDFIIRDGNGSKIRDCKLSRHTGEGSHEEIVLQVSLYGWLFEQNLHKPPESLEVYLGDEKTVQIPYDEGVAALEVLGRIRSLSQLSNEPYSPVGWTKCTACTFRERCWRQAESLHDVALVFGVDQGTAIALRDHGVTSFDELLVQLNDRSLGDLKKPQGKEFKKVGKRAGRVLLQAEALQTGKEKLIGPLNLPTVDNMVMFDLEGLPPQFDELDKVYLWGMQVFGKNQGEYLPALATFGQDGDRKGWDDFLEKSREIFKTHGDIPFIHWANYETTKVRSYIKRYGDRDELAARVLKNCVDLLPLTRDALVLPEYSYSLKVVEKRTGFERSMDEYGGNWSIVQYIRAVETEDEPLRQRIMADILKYNEEDLKATWAVLQWLRRFTRI